VGKANFESELKRQISRGDASILRARRANPGTQRAFIAIQLPNDLLEALQAVQQRLESAFPPKTVRWLPAAQMHLTLRFLGNVPSAHIRDLQEALAEACRNAAPLRLCAQGIGCFPNPGRPRVIWVGMEGDIEKLLALQSRIAPATEPWCERKEDRSFRPHLTLGRVRETSARARREIAKGLTNASSGVLGEWTAREVHLMSSRLSAKGAEHSVLASIELTDTASVLGPPRPQP
jgi:2'-5' RNA ligase